MPDTERTARIILEDGTEFEGLSFGHDSSASGEILYYKGGADLDHLLTDPALKGCILVLEQGNAGILGIRDSETDKYGLETNRESPEAQIAGLVVLAAGEWPLGREGGKTLPKWLKKQQIPAISGIDTRALINRINLRGSMRAKILVSGTKEVSFGSAHLNIHPGSVSVKKPVEYGSGKRKIVLVDCGAKYSTIKSLITDDTRVLRVPCSFDIAGENPDGIVIDGGPGDPTSCEKTTEAIRKAFALGKPVLALGQGAVILAITAGATAFRMPHGHRCSSIPCLDTLNQTKYVITSQNHGYGIRDGSLPPGWYPTFVNAEDNAIEGFASAKGLFSGYLFHSEEVIASFLDLVRNGGVTA